MAVQYVIDIDGNGFSGRFRRLMASNALVMKSTLAELWCARLEPLRVSTVGLFTQVA
jgi:hypothetical protein